MNKKKGLRPNGAGIGYVSVIVIFAMVCLAVFAVMSIRAAQSGDAVNRRAGEYTAQYYEAERKADEVLARLDECALASLGSDFFGESFIGAASDIENTSLYDEGGNVRAVISAEINERQVLELTVVFFGSPAEHGGARFETTGRRTVTVTEESGGALNIWNGSEIPQ